MEVDTFRVGGNESWVIGAIVGMTITFPLMIVFTVLHFLSIGPNYLFFTLDLLSIAFFFFFLAFFIPNFIWEKRKNDALKGEKRMAQIIKVYRSAYSSYSGNGTYSHTYYDYIMIIEYNDENYTLTRAKIYIDSNIFDRINEPCQILVHVKGRFAYVNWKENPHIYNQNIYFKSY